MLRREGSTVRVGRLLSAGVAAVALAGVFALGADGKLIERSETATVPPDSVDASAHARCPKGTKAVLGGFELSGDDLYPTRSKREGKRVWAAGARNYDADESGAVTSTAYCANLKGLKARSKTSSVPAQDEDEAPATVKAKCHRKERLAFGGFVYEADPGNDAYLSELRRAGKRGWKVGAFNFGPGAAPLTAIAYCSERAPKVTTVAKTVTVEGFEGAELKARCKADEKLAFGGYRADVTFGDAFVLARALSRTSRRAWQVDAVNQNFSSAGELTAYAYCAEK